MKIEARSKLSCKCDLQSFIGVFGAIFLEWILATLSVEFGISLCLANVVGHAGTRRKSRSGADTQVALSS
jgi:hypothetical protein